MSRRDLGSPFPAANANAVWARVKATLIWVRLQWATEAILHGMTLKELSDALGYSSPFGFH